MSCFALSAGDRGAVGATVFKVDVAGIEGSMAGVLAVPELHAASVATTALAVNHTATGPPRVLRVDALATSSPQTSS